jgi:invasion protein IalB
LIVAGACAAVAIGAPGPSFAETPAPATPKSERGAAKPRPARAAPATPATRAAVPAAPSQPPTVQQNAAPAAAPAPAPTVLALKPAQPEWTKVCGANPANNAELCYTTRDFASDKGQSILAVAVYDAKALPAQKLIRLVVPHGLLVPPGLRVSVDHGPPVAGHYAMCLPNGCFAEAVTDNAFVEQLKTATNLNVSVRDQTGREVTFAAPLDGFAKCFDGPAIDPQVLQEQQRKVAEELEKRREEMRRRLAGTAAPNADGSATAVSATGAEQAASARPAAPAATAPTAAPAAPHRQVTASTLTTKDLIGANGSELGEIERVVENKDEKKRYVIVSRGGVLGLFEDEYAIPLDRVALKQDRVVARDVTEDQLAKMAFTDGSTYRTLDSSQTIDIAEQQ